MRVHLTILLAGLAAFAAGATDGVASETGPVLVIPGRPGVPIVVDGHDISWAVIEGDWGLGRPSQIDPQVIYRAGPPTLIQPLVGPYYPRGGRAPRLGRDEHDTPRPLQPAQSYSRRWGVQSDPTPVTIPTPYDGPAAVGLPNGDRRNGPHGHHP